MRFHGVAGQAQDEARHGRLALVRALQHQQRAHARLRQREQRRLHMTMRKRCASPRMKLGSFTGACCARQHAHARLCQRKQHGLCRSAFKCLTYPTAVEQSLSHLRDLDCTCWQQLGHARVRQRNMRCPHTRQGWLQQGISDPFQSPCLSRNTGCRLLAAFKQFMRVYGFSILQAGACQGELLARHHTGNRAIRVISQTHRVLNRSGPRTNLTARRGAPRGPPQRLQQHAHARQHVWPLRHIRQVPPPRQLRQLS